LLKQFGTIDEIYKRLGEIKSERVRISLQNAESDVRRNQRLIRLHTDLPCDFNIERLTTRPADADRLRPLYQKWGFRTLLAQLDPGAAGAPGMGTRQPALMVQDTLL
jgi:DNA polymerase-1